MRSVSSSLAQFVENGLGYLPAPIMYGVVNHYTGGKTSRYGMYMLMGWTIWPVLFMLYAFFKQRSIRAEKAALEWAARQKKQPKELSRISEVASAFEHDSIDQLSRRNQGKRSTKQFKH
jgi:hypothetical protein